MLGHLPVIGRKSGLSAANDRLVARQGTAKRLYVALWHIVKVALVLVQRVDVVEGIVEPILGVLVLLWRVVVFVLIFLVLLRLPCSIGGVLESRVVSVTLVKQFSLSCLLDCRLNASSIGGCNSGAL